MMDSAFNAWWWSWILVILPSVVGLIWWWNEIRYVAPVKARLAAIGKKLPPGNMGLPFLGELLTFLWYFKILGSPDDFINSKRNKYGDGVGMYRTFLFGSPSVIACSAVSSRFVLQSDDAFCLPKWPCSDLVGHFNISVAQGQAHKRLSNFIYEAVNRPKALRLIAELTQPRIAASLQSWAEKGTVVAYDEVKKMTFENVGKLFVSFQPGPFLVELDNYFHGMLRGVRANPVNLPGTVFHHALKCRKKIDSIFRTELEKRKQNEQNGSDTCSNDLMDSLMQIKDEDGEPLSDEEVIDNISGLVIAGYESTVLSSMWAIYYLAKYPDVLQKLQEENIDIWNKKKGDFITSEEISQMKYTNKVVDETLRLANVAEFLFRRSDKDVEFKGYVIPKGWRVICWLRYVHMDSRNFDDPMCFNPERWNEAVKPGAYQVFGAGRKICPGNMFARIHIAIFLYHLVTGYKWELINPDAEFNYLPHPKPVDGVKIAISQL